VSHALDHALVGGFQLSFALGAGFALVGALVAAIVMPTVSTRAPVPQRQVQSAVDA
jgi:hypothetical protein